MTNDELKEKITRLPAWAREYIKRLETRSEPAIEEAARARQALVKAETRVTRLFEANEALMELLRCAGKGGLDWAKETVKVLEGYEIFQSTSTGRTIAVPKEEDRPYDICPGCRGVIAKGAGRCGNPECPARFTQNGLTPPPDDSDIDIVDMPR